MEVDVGDGWLAEPAEDGGQEHRVDLDGGSARRVGAGAALLHLLEEVESAGEEVAAGAAETYGGVEEGEVGGAGAGEDLVDEGLGVGVAAAGDGDLKHGEVGRGGVAIPGAEGGPAEEVEGEVGISLRADCGCDVVGGEARLEAVDPRVELLL